MSPIHAADPLAREAETVRAAHAERLDALNRDIAEERARAREHEGTRIKLQWRGLVLIGIGAILSTASNLV